MRTGLRFEAGSHVSSLEKNGIGKGITAHFSNLPVHWSSSLEQLIHIFSGKKLFHSILFSHTPFQQNLPESLPFNKKTVVNCVFGQNLVHKKVFLKDKLGHWKCNISCPYLLQASNPASLPKWDHMAWKWGIWVLCLKVFETKLCASASLWGLCDGCSVATV